MEKKVLKFGLRHYAKPTPRKLRRLGDGLLLVSSIITNENIAVNPTIASVTLICGVLGKFLTNFFSES